jgi:predicted ATP-grasp superfamily ATP-dependent carboligase
MKDSRTENMGVIVLGGHIQGYGIIRILADSHDLGATIIDNKKYNITKHSKYCQKFYHAAYRHTLKLLLAFKRRGLYENWVIFPTDDYYVEILSKNKDQLSDYYKVAVDDWENVKVFFDKRYSYPLAESLGVPIPYTLYPDSLESIPDISSSIKYPCIIKPAVMQDFYTKFRTKAIKCENSDQLMYNLNKISKIMPVEGIMIQEMIPGYFDAQFSVAIIFDGENIVNHFVAKRKRQHPMFFGNATTYAETVRIPQLTQYAERILKKVGYKGICEVEFKYDSVSKQNKFLEVNPRLWKWHLLAKAAKVPLLDSYYSYLLTKKYLPSIKYENAAWIDIVTDIKARFDYLRKGKIVRNKEKNVIHAVYNKHDIKPFIWQLIYLPCFALSAQRNCGV